MECSCCFKVCETRANQRQQEEYGSHSSQFLQKTYGQFQYFIPLKLQRIKLLSERMLHPALLCRNPNSAISPGISFPGGMEANGNNGDVNTVQKSSALNQEFLTAFLTAGILVVLTCIQGNTNPARFSANYISKHKKEHLGKSMSIYTEYHRCLQCQEEVLFGDSLQAWPPGGPLPCSASAIHTCRTWVARESIPFSNSSRIHLIPVLNLQQI